MGLVASGRRGDEEGEVGRAVLGSLYASGALTSYVVPSDEGPHRKYYGITPTGRSQLKSQTDDWAHFSATVSGILHGVPA